MYGLRKWASTFIQIYHVKKVFHFFLLLMNNLTEIGTIMLIRISLSGYSRTGSNRMSFTHFLMNTSVNWKNNSKICCHREIKGFILEVFVLSTTKLKEYIVPERWLSYKSGLLKLWFATPNGVVQQKSAVARDFYVTHFILNFISNEDFQEIDRIQKPFLICSSEIDQLPFKAQEGFAELSSDSNLKQFQKSPWLNSGS